MPSPAFVLKVWVCVWLLVTVLTAAVRSLAWQPPLFVQTMAVSGILVPLMVYVIMPFLRGGKTPRGDRP